MSPEAHFRAAFDRVNQPNPADPTDPDPNQHTLDSLGLSLVFLIQALQALLRPESTAILSGSQARSLTKLAKAADDWYLLLAIGLKPDPNLTEALQQLADPNLPELTPPADPRAAIDWIRRVRAQLYHRALIHICAATKRFQQHPGEFQMTDADFRLTALMLRLNPPPTIERHAKTARKSELNKQSSAYTSPFMPREMMRYLPGAFDNDMGDMSALFEELAALPELSAHQRFAALPAVAAATQQPSPQNSRPKPHTKSNPSKQYKTRRPLQPQS